MLISNRNFCKDIRDLYEYFLLKINCAENKLETNATLPTSYLCTYILEQMERPS